MDLANQLTRQQNDEFEKLDHLPGDQKTNNLCLKYYLTFKQQIGYISIDKISLAFKCAFFIAQKSQVIQNLKGQKITGICLSLNQLLKNYKLDDVMIMLKDIIKKVQIPDKQAQNDLNMIIKQISFLISFYSKFEKILLKLQLKEKVSQSYGYLKIFSSFVWLLYVEAKNKVLHRSLELVQNTWLFAQTLSFMLIYAWPYLKPIGLIKKQKRLSQQSSMKQVKLIIKQKIWEMFLIQNIQEYKVIAKQFENYFNSLVSMGIIKGSELNKDSFLSPELISTNYRRLDNVYQKALSHQHLDERIFFKQRATNLTPSKFTPFARQGYVNKIIKPSSKHILNNNSSEKQNFTSHRILNYQLLDKQQATHKHLPVSQMKLPKRVMQSPSTVKVPLICSTPITTGMQMYNYLIDKTKRRQNKPNTEIQSILNKIFDKYKKDSDRNSNMLKINLINNLYNYLFDEYYKNNEKQVHQEVLKALLVLSIQLVFFVSNVNISFENIEEEIPLHALDEWKVCDFLLKFDKMMPSTLKLHLLDLQVNIICYKIWRNQDLVEVISMFANSQQSKQELTQRIFRRIIHQIAFQTKQLCQSLNLEQRLSELIFDSMKQIITNHTYMLQQRHIDQFIICSIFANCKMDRLQLKFNEIKQKYFQRNPNNKNLFEVLLCKIYMENEEPLDIIKFYNKVYIPAMKDSLKQLRQNSNYNIDKKHLLLQSPLKAIIPNQINFKSKKQLISKSQMTPQTNLLIAYNESPILKRQYLQFKGPLNAKKIINFQYEQQNLSKKNQQQFNNSNNAQMNMLTNDFVSKRFAVKKNQQKSPISNKQKLLTYSQTNLNQNLSAINSPIFTARNNPTNTQIQNNQYMGDTHYNTHKLKNNKLLSTNINFQNLYQHR